MKNDIMPVEVELRDRLRAASLTLIPNFPNTKNFHKLVP
jgi:hypothetical protein